MGAAFWKRRVLSWFLEANTGFSFEEEVGGRVEIWEMFRGRDRPPGRISSRSKDRDARRGIPIRVTMSSPGVMKDKVSLGDERPIRSSSWVQVTAWLARQGAWTLSFISWAGGKEAEFMCWEQREMVAILCFGNIIYPSRGAEVANRRWIRRLLKESRNNMVMNYGMNWRTEVQSHLELFKFIATASHWAPGPTLGKSRE